jgi:hypothetical protein
MLLVTEFIFMAVSVCAGRTAMLSVLCRNVGSVLRLELGSLSKAMRLSYN